jgi:hypothetical protein
MDSLRGFAASCEALFSFSGELGEFLGHAVVEGVLEANEFAEEGVEAAMRVWGLFAEKVVKLDFGVEAVGCGGEQSGDFESGTGNFDEAAFDAEPTDMGVAEALAHEVGAGEFVEKIRGAHGVSE